MIRKPIVAGSFYEANPERLREQIIGCFTSKFGPGALPVSRNKFSSKKKVYGIIAPHAGYQFSGPCQAWAYKEIAQADIRSAVLKPAETGLGRKQNKDSAAQLADASLRQICKADFSVQQNKVLLAETEPADTYIIIGPNHTQFNGDSTYLADFETPLGLVKTDMDFGKKILASQLIKGNSTSHIHEHSIEVQLPFLQFVNKNKPPKLFPIIISSHSYEVCKELGKTIAQLGNKKICIIASSDFTHYGPNYSYVPFTTNKKENMYAMDAKAIELIKKLDARAFFEYSAYKTICGTASITTAIEAVKAMGAEKARLLRYYTSGDVVDDYHNAVGYAAMVFE